MRSLTYILTHEPKNLDDCLDLSSNISDCISATYRLVVEDMSTTEYQYYSLSGIFVWKFPKNTYAYKQSFGRIFINEDRDRRNLSLENANKRLVAAIDRMKNQNILIVCLDNDKQLFISDFWETGSDCMG